ncbi:hypothetical protein M0R45_018240 [Rubus argutus]|uniref:Uncharacterized protein n=1 Tax=Rubus argutus TaxID=59490 RepID=A0AAW1X226_RUBAR
MSGLDRWQPEKLAVLVSAWVSASLGRRRCDLGVAKKRRSRRGRDVGGGSDGEELGAGHGLMEARILDRRGLGGTAEVTCGVAVDLAWWFRQWNGHWAFVDCDCEFVDLQVVDGRGGYGDGGVGLGRHGGSGFWAIGNVVKRKGMQRAQPGEMVICAGYGGIRRNRDGADLI